MPDAGLRRRLHFSRLSVRIFISILVLLIVPFSVMLWYVKTDMEAMLRDEISLKISQNLAKGENEISQLFRRMANISNVFFRDPETIEVFSDQSATYYERDVVFNKVIRDISMQNLYEYIMDDVRITFFDDRNKPHASWSLNYGDYSYLLAQDWVRRSLDANGFVAWSMTALGYQSGEGGTEGSQIALARSIMDDERTDRRLGTLLISIDQQQICRILETYKYSESDSVFASTADGEVLFYGKGALPEKALGDLAVQYRAQDHGNASVIIAGHRYLASFYTIERMSLMSREALKIFYLTDYQRLSRQIGALVTKINALIIFFVAICLVITLFVTKRIADPMRALARNMAAFKVGEAPVAPETGRSDEIGDIHRAYATMANDINGLFASLKKEQATREKYYYESLKSKMNPHFLFNTLTSIRWMAIIRKADNIRESIDALASILKYSMTSDSETVELARELEVIRDYCHIQNMRFGNSIELAVDLPPGLERREVIKFILQPTVENCFKHAFNGSEKRGEIRISGSADGGVLVIGVCDNGPGFSPEALRQFGAGGEPRGGEKEAGLGLRIIDERIRTAYGDGYGIRALNLESGGACVEYRLPLLEPAGEEQL